MRTATIDRNDYELGVRFRDGDADAIREVYRLLADISTDGPSIERTWTAWEVRRAVDQLPDPLREIVRLSHLEGWSLAQIADRLDVAIGTVKSRSHRAHRRLVDSLAYLSPSASEEGAA